MDFATNLDTTEEKVSQGVLGLYKPGRIAFTSSARMYMSLCYVILVGSCQTEVCTYGEESCLTPDG